MPWGATLTRREKTLILKLVEIGKDISEIRRLWVWWFFGDFFNREKKERVIFLEGKRAGIVYALNWGKDRYVKKKKVDGRANRAGCVAKR
jgi:hypothetical protein